MGTALLIAAFSFFLGQAKVIPKPIRIYPVLIVPPLIVLVVMLYWLWRVERDGQCAGSSFSERARRRNGSSHPQRRGAVGLSMHIWHPTTVSPGE